MSKNDNNKFSVSTNSSAAVYERCAEYLAPGQVKTCSIEYRFSVDSE